MIMFTIDSFFDAFISIEANSHWNNNNLSKEVIDKMSIDELRSYAFDMSCRFTDLGYELHEVCQAIKVLRKYQSVK